MKPLLQLIIVLCFPFAAFSQDITGLWKGTMFNNATNQFLDYELVINKEKGKYTGFSHTWFLINDVKYYGVKKIKVHIAKDGKVIIEDGELIANNYPIEPNKKVHQLNVLDLTNLDTEPVLDGLFVTNRTKEYKELTGYINIKRVNPLSQSDLIQFLQKNNKSNDFASAK